MVAIKAAWSSSKFHALVCVDCLRHQAISSRLPTVRLQRPAGKAHRRTRSTNRSSATARLSSIGCHGRRTCAPVAGRVCAPTRAVEPPGVRRIGGLTAVRERARGGRAPSTTTASPPTTVTALSPPPGAFLRDRRPSRPSGGADARRDHCAHRPPRWGFVPYGRVRLRSLRGGRSSVPRPSPGSSTGTHAARRRCRVPWSISGASRGSVTEESGFPRRLRNTRPVPSLSFCTSCRIASARPEGTVKFSGSVADLADETRHAELPRISIPTRHYQPRRLAVSPLRCERSRCRRSPGPTRHDGVLRSDPAVVPHVRFSIRSPAQASTGPAGRHLAPGRGLRHHPGTAALSLACRRSRW